MPKTLYESPSCTVSHEGDIVTKTFKPVNKSCAKTMQSEFYKTMRGVPGVPPLLAETENSLTIPFYRPFKDLPITERRFAAMRLVETLWSCFLRGFAHGDVYNSNIMIDKYNRPVLIDPLPIPYFPSTPFWDCYDMTGRGHHPYHASKTIQPCFKELVQPYSKEQLSCFNDAIDHSSPPALALDDVIGHIRELIVIELGSCGGSEKDNDIKDKPYSSFHFGNSFACAGWRSTAERMAEFVPASEQSKFFAGKTVLDLGCNSGHFSLLAASMGARVMGVECNEQRVQAGCHLAAYLGLRDKTRLIVCD